MKATLEFNLADSSEKLKHKRATSATDAYLVLFCIDQHLRSQIKYKELPAEVSKELQDVRDELYRLMAEHNVNLNDLE